MSPFALSSTTELGSYENIPMIGRIDEPEPSSTVPALMAGSTSHVSTSSMES